ncbi:MAG: GNAT family N-acetyltransferase [Armatimonadota bacterium]|nr:GNAT family N-acetyltransferase [Armatimonadota bacterium]
MADITIRALTDAESLQHIEALQMEIWGMPPHDVVPVHQLKAATSAGGVVLAAFTADGTMVGFCYGFAGWRGGRPLFYSHMAGVRGGLQLQDIGFRLKCAQREAALAMGYEHAVWTFDPLQSVNARFNLHKLGATASRYYVNYYGQMQDELNRGLDSDRLEVDWALRSRRVEAAVAGRPAERDWSAAPRALEVVPHLVGIAPKPPALDLEDPAVLIEIPTDFPQIRQRDRGLAVAWRLAAREAFLTYFGRGYCAVDFLLHPRERLRGEYVLSRVPDED